MEKDKEKTKEEEKCEYPASAGILPTKKEVSERLQRAIDVINEYAFGKICLESGGAGNHISVYHESKHGNFINDIGAAHFRPEPKPPKKLAAVLVRTSGNCMPRVSAGRFDKDGKLLVFDCQGVLLQPDSWGCWYCPSTGEHSETWLREWTPEEFKK